LYGKKQEQAETAEDRLQTQKACTGKTGPRQTQIQSRFPGRIQILGAEGKTAQNRKGPQGVLNGFHVIIFSLIDPIRESRGFGR
jgi:hypothetical protein